MTNRARSRRRRFGTALYVAVLGVGLIVGMIALTTSLTGRMQLRGTIDSYARSRATQNAESGVEYALNWMNRHDDWRTLLTNATDSEKIPVGSGSFYFRVTDVDGDLADDGRDHAVLRVVGMSLDERAFYAVEVDIEPAGRALTCLESSLHANNDVIVGDDATLTGSGLVSANHDIHGESGNGTTTLDAEASNEITGGDYEAETTEGVPAREMPSEHAFDWYVEHGTEILVEDLQDVSFSADKRVSFDSLSRDLNSFGDANAHGIYWIDCGGENVRLRWSRSLGTLVLLNAGASTRVEDVLLLQAEALNYPVLMVQGDLRLDLRSPLTGQELHEGLSINYNPPGIPYLGVEDTDDDDSYPARLDGIVYATGTITVSDETEIQGNLIAENITINGNQTLTVNYTPYANNYPPPGFSAGQGVRVLPGSYRRVGL